MRRQKPLSVKVKAPSRGLISRFPGLTADKFLSGQMQFNVAGLSARASTVSSNVRYEDGVVCAAPGYDLVNPGNAGGSPTGSALLSGIVAHWAMDELSGTRFDSTAAHRDLAPVGGSDPQGSLIVGSAPGELNLAAQFPDAYNPAGALQDYSMDQAIYEPITDTIFGVRGQWLFQFNATTGAFLNSYKITVDAQSPSTIAAMNGNLYVGIAGTRYVDWNAVGTPWAFGNSKAPRDIFVINPSTGLVTNEFNWGNLLGDARLYGTFGDAPSPQVGFYSLTPAGALLFGFSYGKLAGGYPGIFAVDPNNLSGMTANSFISQFVVDMAYDSFNGVIWICDAISTTIFVTPADGTFSSNAGSTPANLLYPLGICYNQAQNKVYAATGTAQILGFSATVAVPGFHNNYSVSTINLGSTCNAFRIKSVNNMPGNPLNGKVLIPTWSGDSVLVYDPSTDTVVSTKTGFSSPFDIVVCPTANFALQSSVNGLKLIT